MQKIYMVVGCPGSGKSWICNHYQLKDKFNYIPHDNFMDTKLYLSEILVGLEFSNKPLLIETPFSMSAILDPLKDKGISVNCVFIQEKPGVIEARYKEREKKEIPKGHISRQKTYLQRAIEQKAFYGTSQEVLDYLKKI